MEVCRYAVPKWKEVEPEHFCACHLYNDAEENAAALEEMEREKAKNGVVKDEEVL